MNNINKIVRLSILTTIALTIFMIELHIPPLVPTPGVKLGLANIITLIVLYLYGIREASTVNVLISYDPFNENSWERGNMVC